MAHSLSIVIPFYKDQVYLDDALASTEGHGIDDLEVIVINDNPSQETDAFLADLATRRTFSVVRHDVNKGLAAARNTGIEAATKDYISFLDADDIYVDGGLAPGLALAADGRTDVTHLPTLLNQVTTMHPSVLHRDKMVFGRRKQNVSLTTAPEAQYIVSSWCSIYRRAFLLEKNVRFDEEQRRFEDRLFVLEAVTKADTISFCDVPARVWRRRLGSITTTAKDTSSVEMQCALIVKCMKVMSDYAKAAPGREMALQRELFNSVTRVIRDVGLLELDPAQTPELDPIRAELTAAFKAQPLQKKIFADPATLLISGVDKTVFRRKTVTRKMFFEAYQMVADGNWKTAHEWRKNLVVLPALAKVPPLDIQLLLHVGLHKTGSTHLQRHLEAGREQLKKAGVLFPQTGFIASVTNNLRDGATPGHAGLTGGVRRDDFSVYEELYRECEASGCKTVIVSTENLSFPLEESKARAELMAVIDRAFARFQRRAVVAVVRRPDEYIERYYRELVGLSGPWSRRTPEQFAFEVAPSMTNMEALLGPWVDFADGDLRIISYEAARKEGLEKAFYRVLGVDMPEVDLGRGATYSSPTSDQIRIARFIALAKLPIMRRGAAMGRFFEATAGMDEGPDRSLFSRETRKQLVRAFAQSSVDFMERYGDCPDTGAWLAKIDAEPEATGEHQINLKMFEAAMQALEISTPLARSPQPGFGLRMYRKMKLATGRFF